MTITKILENKFSFLMIFNRFYVWAKSAIQTWIEQDEILKGQVLSIVPANRLEVSHTAHKRLTNIAKLRMFNGANLDRLIIHTNDRII